MDLQELLAYVAGSVLHWNRVSDEVWERGTGAPVRLDELLGWQGLGIAVRKAAERELDVEVRCAWEGKYLVKMAPPLTTVNHGRGLGSDPGEAAWRAYVHAVILYPNGKRNA